MPFMTTILASGGILLAGVMGIHPAAPTAAHEASARALPVATASVTSGFSVVSHVDGQTVPSTNVSLSGTAAPGARVWLVRGDTIIAGGLSDSSGRWSMYQYTPLNQGANSMSFLVDPVQGPRTEIPFSLVVGSAPVVTTTAATTRLGSVYVFSSSVTSEARPVVEGLATPGATITINEPSGAVIGQTVVGADGMFTLTLTHDLKVGYNELGLKQELNGAIGVTSAPITYVK